MADILRLSGLVLSGVCFPLPPYVAAMKARHVSQPAVACRESHPMSLA